VFLAGFLSLLAVPSASADPVSVAATNYAGGGPHLYLDVCDENRGVCVLWNASPTRPASFCAGIGPDMMPA
jgi:hypothetical protein